MLLESSWWHAYISGLTWNQAGNYSDICDWVEDNVKFKILKSESQWALFRNVIKPTVHRIRRAPIHSLSMVSMDKTA